MKRKLLTVLLSVAALAPGLSAQESSTVFELDAFSVEAMKAFSDQAIPGTTPVAFTEVGNEVLASELGSRDIPLVLNSSPSVYASADSGGAGDARVNVRGFSQRNVSILINGVPTNDIENGWLYWSNWDGLGDVTATIQIQRGLSNVTLPTPSVGGTMNIITEPASARKGGSIKVEAGSDSFYKTTVVGNTGMILNDKFAMTVGLTAKTGDGFARGTWTEGWAYYLGSTYVVNEKNRLELFAIGAPQRHGQRTFASNIAAYDADYARGLGYSEADISAALSRGPVDSGLAFNPNYAPVSPSYTGRQYFAMYSGGTHSRKDARFLNERENYFHKPQINLNWYLTPTDDVDVTTVFYYSGGRGGGSGTLYNTYNYYGFQSSSRAFAFTPNTDPLYGSAYNWDATIAANQGTSTVRGDRTKTAGESLAILRNSVNNQDQYGIVSKVNYQMNEEIKLTAGVDWRTAEIAHYREVRDLLGGDYYLPRSSQASDFWPSGVNTQLGLGDKVDYFNTNTVDWLGTFIQGQYKSDKVYVFAVYGYSIVKYGYTDEFRDDGTGKPFHVSPGSIDGHQIKGGLTYKFSDRLSGFANAGWVSKVPIFDGVIDDISGQVIPDLENEKFKSYELGGRYESEDRKFNINANLYFTKWTGRTETDFDTISAGEDSINVVVYQRGIDSEYKGLEIESAYQPNKWVRFDLAASIGNWKYIDDVPFQIYNADTREEIDAGGDKLYIAGLRVGDAPQRQLAFAVSTFPLEGMSIKLQGRWYSRYWADYDATSRDDEDDRAQAWQIPNYSIYDLHLRYRLPITAGRWDFTVFAHIFNLFDETYISDATDNSSFEAISSAPSHSPQRAEVFFGTPRTYNFGVQARF